MISKCSKAVRIGGRLIPKALGNREDTSQPFHDGDI